MCTVVPFESLQVYELSVLTQDTILLVTHTSLSASSMAPLPLHLSCLLFSVFAPGLHLSASHALPCIHFVLLTVSFATIGFAPLIPTSSCTHSSTLS